jgi:hypothetical protein
MADASLAKSPPFALDLAIATSGIDGVVALIIAGFVAVVISNALAVGVRVIVRGRAVADGPSRLAPLGVERM